METSNHIEGNITGFTVSSGEKRKAVDQFQPNDYHSSITVELSRPVQMSSMEDLKQLFPLMISAVGICKINNRNSQVRDGINPTLCKDVPEATFDSEGKISVIGSIPPSKEKRVLLSDLNIKMAAPTQKEVTTNMVNQVVPSSSKSSKKKTQHDNLPEVKK